MRNAFFIFIFSAVYLLQSGCARQPVPVPIYHSVEQKRPIPGFSHIDVEGIININLSTNCRQSSLMLRGEAVDIANLQTTFPNSVLTIRFAKGYPKHPVNAQICTPNLHFIRYKGQGQITGRSLRSSLLDLIIVNNGLLDLEGNLTIRRLDVTSSGHVQINGIKSENLILRLAGNPQVRLAGMVNIGSITIDGNAYLSLYWLKTRQLVIRERGNAFLQLAGIADRLDVELWGNARFRGRYLRANTLFIKTHDNSLAEVSAVKRQHSLASDASDIHFYNIPQLKTDFMAFNGAVLDMRDWNNPWMQEYNVYNKN